MALSTPTRFSSWRSDGRPFVNRMLPRVYRLALLAAVGSGAFKNVEEACDATIRVVKETKPNAAARKMHDKAFPIYQELYRDLKHEFKRIAALEN